MLSLPRVHFIGDDKAQQVCRRDDALEDAPQTDGSMVRISRANCLTDRVALHTSAWLTIMLA